MSTEKQLQERSESKCELCSNTENLSPYTVSPKTGDNADEQIYVCATCKSQLEDDNVIDVNHWRCLNDSMWSPVPAVQVVAWRMLNKLKGEGWPSDLLDMMYLENDTLAWAKDGMVDEDAVKHTDSNGETLQAGDTVVLIKDLQVKGAGFTAKRGTAVRKISLVADNPEHIEGKVDGQQIVILTKFVKKQ